MGHRLLQGITTQPENGSQLKQHNQRMACNPSNKTREWLSAQATQPENGSQLKQHKQRMACSQSNTTREWLSAQAISPLPPVSGDILCGFYNVQVIGKKKHLCSDQKSKTSVTTSVAVAHGPRRQTAGEGNSKTRKLVRRTCPR